MIEKDTTTKKIYTVKYNELTTYAVEVRGASSSKQAIDFVKANGDHSEGEEGVSSGQAEYLNSDITGNFKSSVERVRQCKGVGMAFKSQGNPDDYWVRTCYEQEVETLRRTGFQISTANGWEWVYMTYNGFCNECNRMLHSSQEKGQQHEISLLKSDGHLGNYWRDNEGKMHYPHGFPEDEKEASQ